MLGAIIFSYPLSLIAGLVLGAAFRRSIMGILWASAVGAALATLLSLEYLSMVGLQQLFSNMILPAALICSVLGIIGASASAGLKALSRKVRS